MKTHYRIFSWSVTILLPFALSFVGLRLILTHAFLDIEYRLPWVPPDDYGFTMQERLHWSKVSWDYILNNADISFLGNLTFPDGTPLFNERELSHMHDVKSVVQPGLFVGYGVCFFILGVAVWARWGRWWREYVLGIKRGGWFTLGLVALLGILGATSFWQFFTVFHELFFKGNSWLFLYSDTLIRLFPLPFWETAFGFVGVLDVVAGLTLALTLRPK